MRRQTPAMLAWITGVSDDVTRRDPIALVVAVP